MRAVAPSASAAESSNASQKLSRPSSFWVCIISTAGPSCTNIPTSSTSSSAADQFTARFIPAAPSQNHRLWRA